MTVVELRQYTLVPGGRDTLVSLFDAHLVESQEADGATIVGQFRDLDRDDRFVWLREFPSMTDRLAALTAFYSGPVWKQHRDAANATMIDSDDVLLMRAIQPFTGYGTRGAPTDSLIVAGLRPLAGDALTGYAEHFAREVRPSLGAAVLGTCQTIHEPNTFPALPVREGEDLFVWFARLSSAADFDAFAARVRALDSGAPVTLLRLAPTPRSALR
ncbi:NIPSNAP family protein [Asanoa sp. NPDC049573]|uniref:NIPSNAP family protein n=1 Tax=Asanoa sp. NPDC049573 TaxID=3155396 RepID=UPI0034383252